jgi:hypothetical protein
MIAYLRAADTEEAPPRLKPIEYHIMNCTAEAVLHPRLAVAVAQGARSVAPIS